MNELFKVLKDFKPMPPADNFYIELNGNDIILLCRELKTNTVKISREKYKFLLDNGIENFIYDGEITRKPKKKTNRVYTMLKKDKKGWMLYQSDPYWPTEIAEGGYTWQMPSE